MKKFISAFILASMIMACKKETPVQPSPSITGIHIINTFAYISDTVVIDDPVFANDSMSLGACTEPTIIYTVDGTLYIKNLLNTMEGDSFLITNMNPLRFVGESYFYGYVNNCIGVMSNDTLHLRYNMSNTLYQVNSYYVKQ